MQTIEQDLARRVKKGRISEDESRDVIGRVQTTTSVEGLSGAPLVVEAVVEDADVKKQVFEDLEGVVGEEAVLATNTSSLSVAGIAAATGSPERVVGMHFFNPVPAMRLVEVVAGPSTEPRSPEPGRGGCREVGQDAGPGLRHARVHREPGGPAVLPGSVEDRGVGRRPREGGRANARGGLQDGPARAGRPDRPRHQPLCLRIALRTLLLPAPLPPLLPPEVHGRSRRSWQEERPRFLRPQRRR